MILYLFALTMKIYFPEDKTYYVLPSLMYCFITLMISAINTYKLVTDRSENTVKFLKTFQKIKKLEFLSFFIDFTIAIDLNFITLIYILSVRAYIFGLQSYLIYILQKESIVKLNKIYFYLSLLNIVFLYNYIDKISRDPRIKNLDNNNILDCSICHSDIMSYVAVSPNICDHAFHQECILNWFNYNQNCPLCRMDVIV